MYYICRRYVIHICYTSEAKGIMKAGLRCKFSQNPKCFKALELTGERTLVEALHDFLWGAGLPSE